MKSLEIWPENFHGGLQRIAWAKCCQKIRPWCSDNTSADIMFLEITLRLDSTVTRGGTALDIGSYCYYSYCCLTSITISLSHMKLLKRYYHLKKGKGLTISLYNSEQETTKTCCSLWLAFLIGCVALTPPWWVCQTESQTCPEQMGGPAPHSRCHLWIGPVSSVCALHCCICYCPSLMKNWHFSVS